MTSHLGEVVLWVEGLTVYRGSQLATLVPMV